VKLRQVWNSMSDRNDLEELADYLISDPSPEDSLALSDLDGFLTGYTNA
jgi:hypothetical protein